MNVIVAPIALLLISWEAAVDLNSTGELNRSRGACVCEGRRPPRRHSLVRGDMARLFPVPFALQVGPHFPISVIASNYVYSSHVFGTNLKLLG